MFKFLEMFKKKQPNTIPTVKPTTIHKKDDKTQHDLFLTELENLLGSSNFFKVQYVKKYWSLYKTYKAFTGKNNNLLSKQPYFLESLTDEAHRFKKNEIKRYAKNIILLANRRAYAKVTLNRFKEDNLFQKVTLIFPKNELICEIMIAQKMKYHNKMMSISKVPIFPLTTCIKCPSCHLGIMYKPYMKI